MEYQGIMVKRIAVGVISDHNAPSENWFPGDGNSTLPDVKELLDMLQYAEHRLIGRPVSIIIAVVYEAPEVIGKQLNRRTPHRIDQRVKLDVLLGQVLADCVEDARVQTQSEGGE
ncbi:hypothetical protein [Fimbriimonas ginsengisoli]|uniref:hypothetical protein n=1 Tax=Fimbriimonas ginsengisoli TaxID=1005039 RepID=UPI00046D643C|nr:hypothetical protein [Fimbriimonas ginsengisoli]